MIYYIYQQRALFSHGKMAEREEDSLKEDWTGLYAIRIG